uniref:Serine hydrolase like n=1 Tax=Salarias fasciatus TaxID=181472 RepID=A0A672F2P0_SALFA
MQERQSKQERERTPLRYTAAVNLSQTLQVLFYIFTDLSNQRLIFSELSVPAPWGEIKGKIWGPDDGYPVLCLHGWADNCASFDCLVPLLPKECRYVATDLVGHGLSSHRAPGVSYLLSDYVADVCRVVEGFGALYPEMVDVLVLLDSYGFVITLWLKVCCCFFSFFFRLLAANPTLSERSVHTLLKRGLTQVEGGASLSGFLPALRRNLALLPLVCWQLKVFLLCRADNGFGMPSKQQEASELLQAFKDRNHAVVSVPGDHHVHLNDPEVVAPLVTDFLRSKVISQQLPA